MPARSTSASTKPKREIKKPATFVPGVTATISKTRAKPKSAPKRAQKAAPKKSPKRAPKRAAKPAVNKRASVSRTATSSKTATPSKTTTPKKAPKASPKKSADTKKSNAKKVAARNATKGQPKYVDMIIEGIKALHKKMGSSRQALEKYIEQNYPQRPDSKKWIRLTLSKMSREGTIQKVKASYKLPSKTSGVMKPVKRVVKKKISTKVPKAPKAPKVPAKVTKAPRRSAKKAPAVVSEIPTAELTGKPVWQYNHNGWHDYDLEASDLVEVQYQEWLNNNQMFDVRSVKSGNFEYNVDFRRMTQTNILHPAHTERNIRRTIK